MKNLKLFLLLFIPFLTIGQNIDFDHTSEWKDLLAKAKDQNKLVFLDAYTSWCGPCKLMARDVFTDEKVATLFNENFINAKIDMEKGQGPSIAQRYEVRAYPTLLFVDGDGEVVQVALGYHNVDQFLDLANKALDPSQNVGNWAKKFDEGNRDPAFLKSYTAMLYSADNHEFVDVSQAYMETQKDWSTNDNEFFIFKYADEINSPMFDYIFEHKDSFVKTFGAKIVENKIEQAFTHKMFDPDHPISLEEAEKVFQSVYPDRSDILFAKFKMKYYRNRGDRENFAIAAVDYNEKFDVVDDLELNDMAWTFYEVIEDKNMLKHAVKWSKKSVKIEDNYYNNDTLAALYYKLGKKRCAKKAANKAIDIAKAANEDASATQELLVKINAL